MTSLIGPGWNAGSPLAEIARDRALCADRLPGVAVIVWPAHAFALEFRHSSEK